MIDRYRNRFFASNFHSPTQKQPQDSLSFSVAVLITVLAFLAVFAVSRPFVPQASGPPSSSLLEITEKPEWSFAARDLLGWWLYTQLANPSIIPAPNGEATINLKTPLNISLPSYLALDSPVSLKLWGAHGLPANLEEHRVDGIVELVECAGFGAERICPVSVYTLEGEYDVNPPTVLYPVRLPNSEVGLIDSRLIPNWGPVGVSEND
mgnify:CR=1 FL=1